MCKCGQVQLQTNLLNQRLSAVLRLFEELCGPLQLPIRLNTTVAVMKDVHASSTFALAWLHTLTFNLSAFRSLAVMASSRSWSGTWPRTDVLKPTDKQTADRYNSHERPPWPKTNHQTPACIHPSCVGISHQLNLHQHPVADAHLIGDRENWTRRSPDTDSLKASFSYNNTGLLLSRLEWLLVVEPSLQSWVF